MVALYFAAFAFSVLLLILTLVATSQYRGNYHVLSTMTTAIVNFGYWQPALKGKLTFYPANLEFFLYTPFLYFPDSYPHLRVALIT